MSQRVWLVCTSLSHAPKWTQERRLLCLSICWDVCPRNMLKAQLKRLTLIDPGEQLFLAWQVTCHRQKQFQQTALPLIPGFGIRCRKLCVCCIHTNSVRSTADTTGQVSDIFQGHDPEKQTRVWWSSSVQKSRNVLFCIVLDRGVCVASIRSSEAVLITSLIAFDAEVCFRSKQAMMPPYSAAAGASVIGIRDWKGLLQTRSQLTCEV